jgi:NAD(P)-dependent dehydrogenase (short-subunit alcohol dehydrogenase family)
MLSWSPDLMQNQEGKTAVITGGTDGIGKEIARELLLKGARVIVAADDLRKGERALRELRRTSASVEFEPLNLGDLSSVEDFCQRLHSKIAELHLLFNNGGLSSVPRRAVSPQRHELMFAVNYLGHFALTAKLFPLVQAARGRIIFQCSLTLHRALLNFFDLDAERYYDPDFSYGQSKLALLMFALELDRRLRLSGIDVMSIPVHPGGARTNIFDRGPSLIHTSARVSSLLVKALVYSFGQSASRGAWPALFAATSAEVESGMYYGPSGFKELTGPPGLASIAPQARNGCAAEKLWEISERMCGFTFDLRDDSNVLPFMHPGHEGINPSPRNSY